MLYYLGEGFALGLSTGVYCAASCLPALLPFVLSEGGKKLKNNSLILAKFLAGRFFAYFIFAFSAVFLSRNIPPDLSRRFSPWLLIVCGLLMLSYFAFPKIERKNCNLAKIRKGMPFYLGFTIGLNVCPPFLVAVLRLAEIKRYIPGGIFFFGFFLASSLFLLPVLIPFPFRKEKLASIGGFLVLLMGLWYLGAGLSRFF